MAEHVKAWRFFILCFYILASLMAFPYLSRAQDVDEKLSPSSETYLNDQFKISFDYPQGCSHEEKTGFLRNMQVVNISCSNEGVTEKIFINLLTDNFMPEYNFKQTVEYILGYGYSADSVSSSQYLSPFIFDQFTNSAGVKGFNVTYSIIKETYKENDTVTEKTPRKATVYDLSQNDEARLRAILFKTSSPCLSQVADTFRNIE